VAFEDLRRVLEAAGLRRAGGLPPGSQGRHEQAATRPAALIEGSRLAVRAVGDPSPCPGPVAFLDGVQRHQVLADDGVLPVVAAEIAAAVRERRGRALATVEVRRRKLLLGRPAALDRLAAPPEYLRVELPDEAPEHPLLDRDAAVARVDAERARLEREVAAAYRARSDAWLIVDGSLADLGADAGQGRTLGVSKSHAVLPFSGGDLRVYLGLPPGHRTSVFQPSSHRQGSVYSWALRLRDWTDRDVFFGLVRVEAAPGPETLARADEYSRWLLAERAPVSAPDARWDRLLYGIRNVEEYLRATLPLR
jgi:hypothetical protein